MFGGFVEVSVEGVSNLAVKMCRWANCRELIIFETVEIRFTNPVIFWFPLNLVMFSCMERYLLIL